MSPESQKYMFIFLGFLVAAAIITISLKMLVGCKSGEIKVNGKCYKLVAQDAPVDISGNVALAESGKIIDKKLDTSATKTNAASIIELKVTGATASAAKAILGARITAMADAPASGVSAVDQKIKLSNGANVIEFAFKQDGKKYSVGQLFTTKQDVTGNLKLEVPSGLTVYEVELF